MKREEKDRAFRPVFVVGCPRSGTTLLQRMLDAHPRMAVAPETFFVRHFWNERDRYGDLSKDAVLDRLVDDLESSSAFQQMGLDDDAFRKAVHRTDRGWPDVFRLLLLQYAEKRGVRRVGEKTPNHVLYISMLRKWFPKAKFVHLVRDPRAVVNSWRSVPWSSGYRWRDAEVWVEYVRAGREAETRFGSARVQSFHFETLVRSPRTELQAVCSFLGLSFHEQMLAFHRQDSTAIDVEREPWKEHTTDPVDASAANRWRQELPHSAQAQVEAIAAPEMAQWDYECEIPRSRRHLSTARILLERPVWKATLIFGDL